MAIGVTLAISSGVLILLKFILARLQTAVLPSFKPFSTINISLLFNLSKAVIFLAFLVYPPSTVTSRFSSNRS